MAHELIHAQEFKNGEALWGTKDDIHETVIPKENAIRKEFKSEGVKERVPPKEAKKIIENRKNNRKNNNMIKKERKNEEGKKTKDTH